MFIKSIAAMCSNLILFEFKSQFCLRRINYSHVLSKGKCVRNKIIDYREQVEGFKICVMP